MSTASKSQLVVALAAVAAVLLLDPPRAAAVSTWSPGANAVLEDAAACHDVTNDVYVIAAVFRFSDTYDSLYRIRVRGASGAGYGDLVEAPTWVASSLDIRHVDCASDGAGAVFVTIDRLNTHSVWFRMTGTTISSARVIQSTIPSPYFSHHPRIAFGGANRVMIAFDDLNYSSAMLSCGISVQQFDATSGAAIAGTNAVMWSEGVTHGDFDVEWSGIDRFLVAYTYRSDDDAQIRMLVRGFFTSGAFTSDEVLQDFLATPSPARPSRVRIVLSNNALNSSWRVLVQTDTASYWTSTGGALIGSLVANPLGARFALCEYWGPDQGVGTTFAGEWVARYVGTWPNGSFVWEDVTVRAHYGQTPGAPYETQTMVTGAIPLACDGANTYTDDEDFLVMRSASAPSVVSWHLFSND